MPTAPGTREDPRAALRADCSRCVGLCCVALPFARSADFALDKPAGVPCPHLRGDDRCGIHDRLPAEGFPGCVSFDCFGAGQQVVQVTFGGGSWRDGAATAGPMAAAFAVLRAVHEVRWYLADAAERRLDPALAAEVAAEGDRVAALAAGPPERLREQDVDALRAGVGGLLARVSAEVRRGLGGPEHRGADLVGCRWRGRDLRGADLRGALLLGADLRGADLRQADLLGADLRGCDLRGADLRDALFLTRPQLSAAVADAATRVPPWVTPARPAPPG